MASIGTDTFFAPLSELNASLKAGEFSAVDLARAFSERLQQLGPRYNALALPLHQEALRQAKEVDKDLKRQRFRGPLQGIPYGVKDLLAYAGQTTTWGANLWVPTTSSGAPTRDDVPERTSVLAERPTSRIR